MVGQIDGDTDDGDTASSLPLPHAAPPAHTMCSAAGPRDRDLALLVLLVTRIA